MQNNTIESLRVWGCDIEGALERLCDDTELYVTCLEMFKDDNGFPSLKKYLEEKNYNMAFEAAHMLKGVSANLGLTPLTDGISDLVEVLRSEEYEKADELYKIMDKSYESFSNLMVNE